MSLSLASGMSEPEVMSSMQSKTGPFSSATTERAARCQKHGLSGKHATYTGESLSMTNMIDTNN